MHPICNIGDYHPRAEIREKRLPCIEFHYNQSMPIPHNSRLGWPTEIFFRSVKNSKIGSGPIPLVEGTIVRMYSTRSPKGSAVQHVELLLQDDSTCIMKVAIAEEVSLV